jgi:uncharacterized protein (DUF2336 family)
MMALVDSFQPLDLSRQDYAGLRESSETRARVIAKVATQYRHRKLTREAHSIAEDILRMAATDTAIQVKRAIVDILKDFGGLPRDIALSMAHDVNTADIAGPVICASDVFTEQDLLDIVATACPQRQEAVARKKRLSEVVSDALIATHSRPVVLALTENPGARISERGHNALLDAFGDDDRIKENLSLRPTLPPACAELLIHMVSESLKDYILHNHRISPETTARIIQSSREKATVQIIQAGTPASHILRMVRHLHANHRLTDSLIIRAICTGDIRFFEFALAERAQLPVNNISRILASGGWDVHERLYAKCRFSERIFPLMHAALALYLETLSDHSEEDSERFGRRVMERLLTLRPGEDPETFERLLEKLDSCSQTSVA